MLIFLLLCGLFYVAICFGSCLYFFALFYSCVLSPFSIAITSLGEEKANVNAFRTFIRFALVSFCLFPLPLCVWEGLRIVLVALPGFFSYGFFFFFFRIYQTSFICTKTCLSSTFIFLGVTTLKKKMIIPSRVSFTNIRVPYCIWQKLRDKDKKYFLKQLFIYLLV